MQTTKQSQDFVFKKLMLISGCDEDFKNQSALLFSVVNDLNALFNLTTRGLGWIELLQDVIGSLHLEQQIVARFQHYLIHFTSLDTIKLVVLPSIDLNVERRTLLHCVRGLIISWHLDHNVKIPLNLLTFLEILFKAKSKDVQILIQNLDLDLKNLQDYQSQLGTTNKWFKFLSNLIIALQDRDIGPSVKYRSSESTSFNESQLFIKNNKTDPLSNLQKIYENKKTSKETKNSGDLFNYNRVELDHLYRKEFSGIANLFKHYHPYELSQFVPALVKEFQKNDDEVILAFFLCLFLRCHVSRFDLVVLNKSAGKNLFLDIEQGFLIWNRQALIKNHDEFEEIKIPLPFEIARALKEKYIKHPDALTLENLFDVRLP